MLNGRIFDKLIESVTIEEDVWVYKMINDVTISMVADMVSNLELLKGQKLQNISQEDNKFIVKMANVKKNPTYAFINKSGVREGCINPKWNYRITMDLNIPDDEVEDVAFNLIQILSPYDVGFITLEDVRDEIFREYEELLNSTSYELKKSNNVRLNIIK